MYKHIMVPLDGSELAECVLGHVIDISRGCGVPKVSLVRVVPPLKLYTPDLEVSIGPNVLQKIEEDNLAMAQAYLAEQQKKLQQQGIAAQVEVMFGDVVDGLASFADKHQVDLIVIATHGRSGVSRWVWGSVADRILRSSKVPILMVRPEACQVPAAS